MENIKITLELAATAENRELIANLLLGQKNPSIAVTTEGMQNILQKGSETSKASSTNVPQGAVIIQPKEELDDEEQVYTIDGVKKAIAGLADKTKAKQILAKWGCSKISDIPQEKLAEFIELTGATYGD